MKPKTLQQKLCKPKAACAKAAEPLHWHRCSEAQEVYNGLYRGYIGVYRGYIGIMEKKMETTSVPRRRRPTGLAGARGAAPLAGAVCEVVSIFFVHYPNISPV